MGPLQASSPSPGIPLFALLAFVLVGGFVGTVGSAVVRRLRNPVGKYRLLYALVILPVSLLAYGTLTLLGFGTIVVGALPIPSGIETLIADFIELLAAGLVWLAAYVPTVPGLRAIRDIDVSTRAALVRMARYVVALAALVTIAIAPFRLTPAGITPVTVAASFGLLAIIAVFASPWLIALLRPTHTPTDAAPRIATLRDRAGLEVRDVVVIETDDTETANALVRGPPGYRRLFVTNTFLDRFGDDTAEALLAVRAGRLRSRVLGIRLVTAIVAGLALVAALTGMGPRWALLGLAGAAILVGCWRSRRGILAGDDFAAGRVGAGTVAAALERYAEVHALEPTRRRLPNPLSVTVALGDRIDRLRARAAD